MLKWFKQLDEILRGDATRMSSLTDGHIRVPMQGLVVVIAMLGVFYGLCMTTFTMIRTGGQGYMFMVASAVKVPLLFLLTLAVTFPSLYVFNALIGSRLTVVSALRLLAAGLGVILAVLASLGPIVVFFSLSTTNYPFMILLNVVAGTVAGILGLAFLLRTLHRLIVIQDDLPIKHDLDRNKTGSDPDDKCKPASENDAKDSIPEPIGALDRVGDFTSRKAKNVFKIWVVVFALVGAQMSWVLRPFIGNPNMPFEWFRERQSNFFIQVIKTLEALFS